MNGQEKKRNYHYLLDVVDSLRFSQGFYGRVWRTLQEMDEEEKAEFINSLPKFNSRLDVVYYFEQ